jgi:magnesium transporter
MRSNCSILYWLNRSSASKKLWIIHFIAISAYEDREEAVRLIDRYDLPALPVIDVDGVLVGVVTVDDVLDVARQEATEDFHKVGGVAPT